MKLLLQFFCNFLFNIIFVSSSSELVPLNYKCVTDYECGAYTVCKQKYSDGKNQGICSCIIGYKPGANNYICKKNNCMNKEDCEKQHENTDCVETNSIFTCKCINHFKESSNKETCILLNNISKIGEKCQYDGNCGSFAECRYQTCQCKFEYKTSNNGVNCEPVNCYNDSDCSEQFLDTSILCNITIHQCFQLHIKHKNSVKKSLGAGAIVGIVFGSLIVLN